MVANDSGIIEKVVVFIMLGARRRGKFTARGLYREERMIRQHPGPIPIFVAANVVCQERISQPELVAPQFGVLSNFGQSVPELAVKRTLREMLDGQQHWLPRL
jgi:hypothetical protein